MQCQNADDFVISVNLYDYIVNENCRIADNALLNDIIN